MMKHRKPNRLKHNDYSRPGWYFVTICTHDKVHQFGRIEDGEMVLNSYGEVAQKYWLEIPNHFEIVEPDEYVIMPNHVHGIVIINRSAAANVGNSRDCSLQKSKIKSPSELMGSFKTTSSKLIHRAGSHEFKWQKSFYDHVIRNDRGLENIRKYIANNPLKCEDDLENDNVIPLAKKKKFWRGFFRDNYL